MQNAHFPHASHNSRLKNFEKKNSCISYNHIDLLKCNTQVWPIRIHKDNFAPTFWIEWLELRSDGAQKHRCVVCMNGAVHEIYKCHAVWLQRIAWICAFLRVHRRVNVDRYYDCIMSIENTISFTTHRLEEKKQIESNTHWSSHGVRMRMSRNHDKLTK